jgi:hypothetical protein
LFASKEDALKQQLMCCHQKLYAGNKECSFEELRAWRYIARKKEEEEQQRKMDQYVSAKMQKLKADIE